mgnify:CR=1 FL=1
MTSLVFLFGSAFVVGLSGAMMPGPVLTATIAQSLRRGFGAGPRIVLGHALLELAVLGLVIAGLSPWLQRTEVIGPLGLAGGALLVWMGAHTALTARAAAERSIAAARETPAATPSGLHGPEVSGILLSLSNPYWLLWWATIGLNYAALSLQRGVPGLAAFYAGHISSDLVWYSAVAAAVAAGRRVCPPLAYRLILLLCGLALVALGAYFGAGGLAWLCP